MGKNRAKACELKLAALNSYVRVAAVGPEVALDDALLTQFTVVVATNNKSLNEVKRLDETCRRHGVCFIAADAFGLFGSVFCDFGPAFTVLDQTGEEPGSAVVVSVTRVRVFVGWCVCR